MSPHNHRYALIVAGGMGARLWPMSRRRLPKQFQHLLGTETPFQHIVRLVQQVIPLEQILVIAPPAFHSIIVEQIPGLPKENILFEPAQQDNGPAVALGIQQAMLRDSQAIVATFWADHLVLDEAAFAGVVRTAFAAAEAQPTTFVVVGSKPTRPDPSLGYIHVGKEVATYHSITCHQVRAFIEKPDQATAERFFASWDYLWNVGYNVVHASHFFAELDRLRPELTPIFARLGSSTSSEEQTRAYEELPKLSLDYLLTQQLEDITVVPADMGWSDIGTWSTLYRMMVTKSGNHMVTDGEVQSINSANSLVFAKDRPITLVGVRDLIVVDTGDTLLIMHHDAPSADLKKLVQDTLTTTNPDLL
jgi:mannose-1-phosphate guanylyltransferase/mannose-6-phosphate isomerase